MNSFRCAMLTVSLAQFALLAGCGGGTEVPELAKVSGMVSINGVPTEGLNVIFEPKEGRPSLAVTGPAGEYVLHYPPDHEGAVLGDHTVRIDYAEVADMEIDVPIPPKFNTESTLKKTVTEGENSHNFNLEIAS